uniref:HNH endonuclease n=1 Tax=Pseudidiomarina sp. TaxID=2081707 RepID=UPI003A97AD50
HIVPWSQDKTNRLNPSNGLCLSALYDRAFDQGLMTFDEDWRVVLSAQFKQPEPAMQRFFLSIEGQKIVMPERFSPDSGLMQQHRDQILWGETDLMDMGFVLLCAQSGRGDNRPSHHFLPK